jgi:hypothetical protein
VSSKSIASPRLACDITLRSSGTIRPRLRFCWRDECTTPPNLASEQPVRGAQHRTRIIFWPHPIFLLHASPPNRPNRSDSWMDLIRTSAPLSQGRAPLAPKNHRPVGAGPLMASAAAAVSSPRRLFTYVRKGCQPPSWERCIIREAFYATEIERWSSRVREVISKAEAEVQRAQRDPVE